jgi:hypothetical protein
MKFKEINSIKNSRPNTSQLRMRTISNIKPRCKGINLKKKLINNSRQDTLQLKE